MAKYVDEKFARESKAIRQDKKYGYALELPYSKQNVNFKTRVTRIGRDLIIIGLIVCLLRTGCVSQWLAGYMAKTKEIQRGWLSGWFKRETQQPPTLFGRFKSHLPSVSKRLPALGYALESGCSTIKTSVQYSIGWLVILEDHLPDIGVCLLVIGGFLFVMGYTLILRDNWVSYLEHTNCPQCLCLTGTPNDAQEESPKRDVELAEPIFKFVKVFPYHKRFSGTPDFSLNSVKMRLIIQFNRATQTY